jgi:hypothetical protein
MVGERPRLACWFRRPRRNELCLDPVPHFAEFSYSERQSPGQENVVITGRDPPQIKMRDRRIFLASQSVFGCHRKSPLPPA